MVFTDCPITPRDSQRLSVAPTGATDQQPESRKINGVDLIR